MRYRQEYFREEAEQYHDMLMTMTYEKKKELKNVDRGWDRRMSRKNNELAFEFFKKSEAFNKECYKQIERITENMDEKFKVRFDNYATGFALMCEEFLKAKNTTEMLTLAKLYNQGLMDSVFTEVRAQKENEKNNSSNVSPDSDGLQEEQQSADPNAVGGFNSPH